MKLLALLLSQLAAEGEEIVVQSIFTPSECTRKVEKGDFVRYHYSGYFDDGSWFDDSFSRGSTYNTYVGSGWLIPGMDMALYGMCVKERRLVRIPPHLAYGDEGVSGIPGGSYINFYYELQDINNRDDKVEIEDIEKDENCKYGAVKEGDFVRYHYDGILPNGKEFHSSHDDGMTYNTYVGKGWLIKGMDEALLGMCPNGKRKISIPPHLAYGEQGDGNNIPGHSTIKFEVHLLDRFTPEDRPVVTTTFMPENCTRKTITGDFLRYRGSGETMDGEIFWSTKGDETYNTYVGYGKVIPGMDVGLADMCEGEEREIIIPPTWAYGEKGSASGAVPASATIIFRVKLIDFHNPKDEVQIIPKAEEAPGCKKAAPKDIIRATYAATEADGAVVSESSEIRTVVESGTLIIGLYQAIVELCEGVQYEIIIPPHLAYGEWGLEDYISGSVVLHADLKIHESWPQMDALKVALCDEEPTFEDCAIEGSLSQEEFEKCLEGCARIQGQPLKTREWSLNNQFQRLDRDNSGALTKDEFQLTIKDHDEL